MQKKQFSFLISFFLIFLIISCQNPNQPVIPDVELDKKIGQMLLIGFRGTDLFTNTKIIDDIKSKRIGGVILFDRDVALGSNIRNIINPTQLKTLIQDLQKYGNNNLFIAIDQEGGRVCRLKESYGFNKTVSQEYLGKINNKDTTKFYSDLIVNDLKNMGINFNYSPVVDLNINPESPAIGKIGRSFSVNSETVVFHSSIIIKNQKNNRIISSLKHFPGHGSALADSHLGFTDVTNTWKAEELNPYRELIKTGDVDVIMTSHIFNSQLDNEFPATMSKKIITNLLRNDFKYNGVVISDDMGMGAIVNYYGLETAIEKTINAGVDILLFANNLVYDDEIAKKAIVIIKKLISEGKIKEETINQSYYRVMRLKQKYHIMF